MKKILSLILALALICGLTAPAFAANMNVSVEPGVVEAGGTVTVTVTLEQAIDVSEGATMLQGDLKYDGSVLEFQSVEKSDELSSAAKHKKQDKVSFSYLSLTNEPVGFSAGVLVTVTFLAKEALTSDAVEEAISFTAYVQNPEGKDVGDLTVTICEGHEWEEATCTEARYCTNCGLTDGEAADHTGGEVVVENEVAATCTEDGNYDNVVYCSVCEEELSRETVVVKSEGHTGGEVVVENEVAATCTEDGSYDNVVYCSVCEEELSRESVTVEAEGHNYESHVTVPSCTEDGVRTYICIGCGDTYTEAISATGHTEGEVVVENEVAATCTGDGSYDNVVYCSVCGEELSRETVVVKSEGHTEGEVVVENEVAATCTGDGSYDNVVYCAVCGEELSREAVVVEATGHDYQDGACGNCGEADPDYEQPEEPSVPSAPIKPSKPNWGSIFEKWFGGWWDKEECDHSYTSVVTDPTCTQKGYTTYTCTVCGDSYKDSYVAASGHSYEDGVCTGCGKTEPRKPVWGGWFDWFRPGK